MKISKLAFVSNLRLFSKGVFHGSREGSPAVLIPVDQKCWDGLRSAMQYAVEAVNGTRTAIEAAHKIATQLGDCYTFLQQDIEVVDRLAAIAGLIDEYDEVSHQPNKANEVESEISEAMHFFVGLGNALG